MTIEFLLASFELWGVLICSGIGIYFFVVRKINTNADFSMCIMQFVTALTLAFDVGVVVSQGVDEKWAHILFDISMLATLILQYLMVALFVTYVRHLADSNRAPGAVSLITYFVAAIAALFSIISAKYTHWYYYIDEHNVYHRESFYALAFVFSGILFSLIIIQIISCSKKLAAKQIVSLCLYVTVPVIMIVLQVVLKPGIGLLNIGMAISLISIFIVNNIRVTFSEIELNKKVLQQNVVLLSQNKIIAEKKEEIENLQLNMVITQMQPHFVFNVLNIIYYLCAKDSKLAQTAIDIFSSYLRANIDSLVSNELAPFSKELEHVKNYLDLEKLRFDDELEIEYDIGPSDFHIPMLVVQPLAENAVKHGIAKSSNGGKLVIRTIEDPDNFYIYVIDNGVGFDTDKYHHNDERSHIGIDNVRLRIEKRVKGKLEIFSSKGRGTTAVITVPKLPAEKEINVGNDSVPAAVKAQGD
ncbi:MAG: histidine kinase [Clostridiales bacterium]|nr:histidine kinase [Clostridiales bacterium]